MRKTIASALALIFIFTGLDSSFAAWYPTGYTNYSTENLFAIKAQDGGKDSCGSYSACILLSVISKKACPSGVSLNFSILSKSGAVVDSGESSSGPMKAMKPTVLGLGLSQKRGKNDINISDLKCGQIDYGTQVGGGSTAPQAQPTYAVMPNVIGVGISSAINIVTNSGLFANRRRGNDISSNASCAMSGNWPVIAQQPVAGTRLKFRSTVILYTEC
jgi:hypothetical protein